MNINKAISVLKCVVKTLDELAGELNVDDPLRKRIAIERQDLEDIISDLQG